MEAIASTNQVYWAHRPTPRLGRVGAKSPAECPPEPIADAFLSQQIEPLISLDQLKQFDNPAQTEADFFASLSYLEALYRFRVDDGIRQQAFPQNVALAFLEAKRAVQNHHPEMQLDIYDLTTDGGPSSACLVTYFEYDKPSSDSYWLGVYPLYERRGKPSYQSQVNLLRSIMSYMDEVAGVPWYNDGDGFLYYQHEYLLEQEEWRQVEQVGDDEEDDAKMQADQVRKARQGGDKTRKWWRGQFHNLARRIARFMPKTEHDKKLLEIAQSVVKLSQTYPNRRIGQSYADAELLLKEDDEYMIELWSYLSFNWDNFDFLSDCAMNSLNEEWGNTSSHANPVHAQYFYKPQTQIEIDNDFSYEQTFFDVVDDLGIYLNQISRIENLSTILGHEEDQQPSQSVL